ncbi:hypothetical protein VP01_251g2 [Puccinia sorghi]|uniref:Uncharacterized protein n=1 Tax=Puccinia sorghi TaxID=27349 RepID=A0A0L6V7B6_9BASI|nr:hypothetical protein VP01_251g2 [Puccinia sorghi]
MTLFSLLTHCKRLRYEKCGIIQYGPPDSLVKNLPTEIKLTEGSIKFMNTYKYLGCWITNKWQKSEPYLLEREHAKSLAGKTNKWFFSTLPLLHDKGLHLLCKNRLIQTYIMAIGSYGAEWIAMSQKRTCKIQAVIDLAMRIAYGHKSTSLKLNSLLLCTEMGITPYSFYSTKQRIRLWYKKPHLKTILKDLIACPANSNQGKTWVQNTKRNLDILMRGSEIIEDKWNVDKKILHIAAWIKSMRDLKLALHPPALKTEGSVERVTQAQQEERMQRDNIHNCLMHQEFERESKRNNKVRLHDLYSLGRTANYIATSIHIPRVIKGVAYLSKLCMGALPTNKERIQTMNALHEDCDLKEYKCPSCDHYFEIEEEWCHYILYCRTFQKEREKYLQDIINTLYQYTEGESGNGDKHIYILLLGGLLRELYPESSQAIGTNNETYVETAYGSHDLTQWVNVYGHILHIYPQDGKNHGYVAVSAYLQEIVPQIERLLYKEVNQTEKASQLPVSSSGQPMLRTNESLSEETTCPYESNRARPNGMPNLNPSGIG